MTYKTLAEIYSLKYERVTKDQKDFRIIVQASYQVIYYSFYIEGIVSFNIKKNKFTKILKSKKHFINPNTLFVLFNLWKIQNFEFFVQNNEQNLRDISQMFLSLFLILKLRYSENQKTMEQEDDIKETLHNCCISC